MFLLIILLSVSLNPELTRRVLAIDPSFGHYRAAPYLGKLSNPRIVTSEQRRFRTKLRQAIAKGFGVVDGGTEHERVGPNFAGSFVLVQWGCGLNCMEAAAIDGKNGRVVVFPRLPSTPDRGGFEIPTFSGDLRTLRFRADSRLLGIPRFEDGFTYWYALARGWQFVGKTRTSSDLATKRAL